ncbi:NUDIX hydrolase [Cohnella pontilimi]|uniref:NUDIX hydrolase n=1 Tax=Cohnella pontilimi TaxID=2564100 RepID=A0A4U0FKK4_9BACL|nr:NUDIX domain-containing protein [Cohnella pontilimi]TJY44092.1 NUDIX hydrolase [Cohnella pontilimi]
MERIPLRDRQGLTEEEFLQTYDPSIFVRPSVTVDMLIFTVVDKQEENYRKLPNKSLKLLLVKRGVHPYLGQWALPGGFVTHDESVDDAALRELRSETNIDNVYMEQLYTWGEVNRDPRTRVVSCSYMALVDSTSLELKAGDDAADARWFDLTYSLHDEKRTTQGNDAANEYLVKMTFSNDTIILDATVKVMEKKTGKSSRIESDLIESNGIAFDHAKMIQYAVKRLRNKIEYTDIAFNLMPELFTLSELQQVYEVILGKELLPAAFRRKIAGMVTETDQFTKDAGHRPARLFRFNPNWRFI